MGRIGWASSQIPRYQSQILYVVADVNQDYPDDYNFIDVPVEESLNLTEFQ